MKKENKVSWTIEVGFYPGILAGIRTYEEPEHTTHVLYIPFVDLALCIYK
jgi:hypothetical protein|tara:strand:+ start:354 stop:503 length:150 start_codon:yes stop_codon:yes gene_type:complete